MQEERFGERDLTYSQWHRHNSIGRYVGRDMAKKLSMIDIDTVIWVEFGKKNSEPIVLIETARYNGHTNKAGTIIRNLSQLSGIPAYTVLYEIAEEENPEARGYKDIKKFYVKRLNPCEEKSFRELTPQQYAQCLASIRHHWGMRECEYFGGPCVRQKGESL